MEFLATVNGSPYMSFTGTESVDLVGLPADTEVRLSFSEVPLPAHVEALQPVQPPAAVAAPAAWWRLAHEGMNPLVWSGLRDVEDGSDDQRLGLELFGARNEWDNARSAGLRAQAMKDRGLG